MKVSDIEPMMRNAYRSPDAGAWMGHAYLLGKMCLGTPNTAAAGQHSTNASLGLGLAHTRTRHHREARLKNATTHNTHLKTWLTGKTSMWPCLVCHGKTLDPTLIHCQGEAPIINTTGAPQTKHFWGTKVASLSSQYSRISAGAPIHHVVECGLWNACRTIAAACRHTIALGKTYPRQAPYTGMRVTSTPRIRKMACRLPHMTQNLVTKSSSSCCLLLEARPSY